MHYRLTHQRSGGYRDGQTRSSISHWVPRALSVCHGHVRFHVLCLHSCHRRGNLVWDSIVLRCKSDVDVSSMYIRAQMGKLGEPASLVCGRDIEAAAVLLPCLVYGASFRKYFEHQAVAEC